MYWFVKNDAGKDFCYNVVDRISICLYNKKLISR